MTPTQAEQFFAVICNGMRHEFRPEAYKGRTAQVREQRALFAAECFAENNGAKVAIVRE
jgi:hypothetical protein